MWSVKAVYENGHVLFPEGNVPEGRMEVVVVFPESSRPDVPREKDAGKKFVEKWKKRLGGVNAEDWKEQRVADLEKKHR